ncbi:MAG: ATP-dependent acyl-CoA ligase [Burkholderiales bacterium]|nr:MAG: ATP-dependent acyl-CoA ligase [Burkholderiales bacterium]
MYSGFDDPGRWVLPAVLAEQAARTPDARWIETTTGERASFSQAFEDVERAAARFASLGVAPGDHVAVMLPNGLDLVRAWLGLGRLGAVAVLLNTELTGAFLRHPLADCGAALAVVDAALMPAFLEASADVPTITRVLVAGGPSADAPRAGLATLPWDAWVDAPRHDGPMPRAQDIACVMYTSGTSGPAKGVLMPHAHCFLYGRGAIDSLALTADDVYYIVLPLFHANGLLMQLAATLIAGCAAIVRPRFSASGWLDDVRRHGATATNCLGALAAFLVATPPTPHDRDHRLRVVKNAPNLAEHEAVFRERFGVPDVTSGFGMTEVNIPTWGRLGESLPGTAGRVYDRFFEMVIADPETDRPVAPGELGEILVRPKVPFGFMAGYHGRPQQTVEAWRNLWFHTGDAGTLSADGVLTFVDRIKDCIRRRGENLSATEIETAFATLEGVAEVAAYAVPSDIRGGEDEVMLAVVPAPGASPTPQQVAAHAERVLPRFARPRYVGIVDALPKTATGKVQRAMLRKRGAEGAWDLSREAASGPTGAR